MNTQKDKERARLIRKIIVANILSMPLKKYLGLLEQVEKDPIFRKLCRARPKIISIKKLPGSPSTRSLASDNCVACVKGRFSGPLIVFYHRGLNRKYQIDAELLGRWIGRNGFDEPQLRRIHYIINKLELISVRNRICNLVLTGVTQLQRNFLMSGDSLFLKVLSQRHLVQRINQQGRHNPMIDESRVSRLISSLFIHVNGSGEMPLKKLFPTKRALLKRHVSDLIISEWKDLESERIKAPYTDAQIASKLRRLNVSRRTVAHCRKVLGIPNRYKRADNCGYRHITQNYSPSHPLSRSMIKKCPAASGVYELSTRGHDIEYPRGLSKIFYIGSGKNICARLKEHMRAATANGVIRKYIAINKCMFRYKSVPQSWRSEEKKLYRIFTQTYGSTPKANRISP